MKIYSATTNTVIYGKLDSHYNHMETLKMVYFVFCLRKVFLKQFALQLKKRNGCFVLNLNNAKLSDLSNTLMNH